MFFVYILNSEKNDSYYIGSCSDLVIRLAMHNDLHVKSTKRYAPWTVVYSEQYEYLKDARKRELQIKRWKKRSAIEKLIEYSKIINL